MRSPGQRLLRLWRRLHRLPGGTRLFSLIFGWRVPYSRSVRPHIRVLFPGHAEVEIPDRRANRQHLGSVHAVALVNLAEVASGTAMLTALPPGTRGIVTGLSIEYLKKARGTLAAESTVTLPDVTESREIEVHARIRDAEGAEVARATVTWLVGPNRS